MRLIDADHLNRSFDSVTNLLNSLPDEPATQISRQFYNTFRELVGKCPTVNAVPVDEHIGIVIYIAESDDEKIRVKDMWNNGLNDEEMISVMMAFIKTVEGNSRYRRLFKKASTIASEEALQRCLNAIKNMRG